MPYLTGDFITFFQDLAANNNREWFKEHKKRYEKSVKEPFVGFVAALIEAAKNIDDRIEVLPKQAIFRIYRDVRFSKDKTPYKIYASAIIAPGGRKNMSTPAGFYAELHPEHFRIYSGLYQVDREDLVKVRTAIMEQPERFRKLINEKQFKVRFGTIQSR